MHIVIVDDHLLFTQSLKYTLLRLFPGSQVTSYTSPEKFLAKGISGIPPDVVISDIVMGETMNGIVMMERARQITGLQTKYILLTAVNNLVTVQKAIRKGASAFLTKDISEEELAEAIKNIQNGTEPYVQKAMRQQLMMHLLTDNPKEVGIHLSKKEEDIVNYLCSGRAPKEMASAMGVSVNAVNQYIKKIKKKFNVSRTIDIALFAVKNGYYDKDGDT